ncbi:hypothetical protein NDU88_001799 [Pleurodeles waltl]|uniref:RNase H type-1 domain-containing protein n=1 Tax=Pleurodeles waltl TaxID=8319 RepID=A0AAV7Q518_PLEWA|nr:hypothetical protein NDU88_001799 [Pleurodeles waltl]
MAWRAGGRSIAFLELFPLVVAVRIWGHLLMHKRLLFRVDNLVVVQVVNRQSAKDVQVLQLLCVSVLECLNRNIFFREQHVPEVNNDIADALSRSQWERVAVNGALVDKVVDIDCEFVGRTAVLNSAGVDDCFDNGFSISVEDEGIFLCPFLDGGAVDNSL